MHIDVRVCIFLPFYYHYCFLGRSKSQSPFCSGFQVSVAACRHNVHASLLGFPLGEEGTLSVATTNTDTFFFVMWAGHAEGAEGNLVSITADQALCITVEQNVEDLL